MIEYVSNVGRNAGVDELMKDTNLMEMFYRMKKFINNNNTASKKNKIICSNIDCSNAVQSKPSITDHRKLP